MNGIDVLFYCGLSKFLNKKKNENYILNILKHKSYILIQIDISLKELGYIKNNFEDFIMILNSLLFLINNNSDKYYKNITFNTLKIGSDIYNNCIFLYNSQNDKEGFCKTKGQIEIYQKEESISNTELQLLKIIKLVEDKNISVRNLIKIGIQQIRARSLYNFLKEKGVFTISKYNQNNKVYNVEKFKKLLKSDIISVLEGSVGSM